MDLTPVYELRSRLRATAIAGTELVSQDYRLKRALESMKPLEKASPVFAKIGMSVGKLLAPDCSDRAGTLMEAISWVEAVLCTQGAMAVSGELREIEYTNDAMNILNIPYSVLHTLLDSLWNSGQGRYSYVLDMHKNHPELFEDYRVKNAMVQALGASYAELAEQVAEWLKKDSKAVIPLLKSGFDKNGKKEMLRRVQVIEAISKDEENAFYLEQIPDSDKAVRGALIFALRHSQENVDVLMDLTRTEKGNCKKMAYWTMACMEGQKAEDFWREYVKKKPWEAVPYLRLSKENWANELISMEVNKLLQEWITKDCTQEMDAKVLWKDELSEKLGICLDALYGKNGEVVCESFRKIAEAEKMLQLPLDAGGFLHWAYLCSPSKDLGELVLELYESYGTGYFSAALSAKLVDGNVEDCCEWVEQQVWQKSLLNRKIKENYVKGLLEALGHIVWDTELQSYVLRFTMNSPADGQEWEYKTSIQDSVQGYFTDLLMKIGKYEADDIMSRWIPSIESDYCEKLREYYYKKASVSRDNRSYLSLLKRCGAKECRGLAVKHFSRQSSVSLWEIAYYFYELPGSVEEKREEARKLCELIRKGGVRGVRIKEENVEVLIDNWVRESY